VVLVVIDTLRADHLGVYDYPRPTSPRMDEFAADSTVFKQAISTAPWTLPALGSIMTSLYPSAHGAKHMSNMKQWREDRVDFAPVAKLADSHTTLAEALRAEGYRTAAFVRGSYPSAVFGMGQGFEHFEDNDAPGVRFMVESALDWLDAQESEPFFMYLHTVEVHSPYMPVRLPDKYAERNPDAPLEYYDRAIAEEQRRYRTFDFNADYAGSVTGSLDDLRKFKKGKGPSEADLQQLVDLYDRGIAYTDYWMGELLDGLKERGVFDNSIIMITSDHGEEFFEHGHLEHSTSYFDELLHVPLILRHPSEGHGVVVEDEVSLIDIYPSILDGLDISHTLPLGGRSLRPLWLGGSLPERPVFGESIASRSRKGIAVRTNRWKFIHWKGGKEELYDLAEDPSEQVDLSPSSHSDPLREQIGSWRQEITQSKQALKGVPEAVQLDEETQQRLRDLGYAIEDEQ
jgi:arylsulfatase A-like enzyme